MSAFPCPHCGKEIETDLLGKPLEKGNAVHQFITSYCDAYKARHGTSPVPSPGAAKAIVRALGKDEAIRLAEVYLAMKDQYFINKGYDLETLRANLTKVKVAADTGRITSREQAKQSELGGANAAAIRRAIERKHGQT
jgi:hypothetical protein